MNLLEQLLLDTFKSYQVQNANLLFETRKNNGRDDLDMSEKYDEDGMPIFETRHDLTKQSEAEQCTMAYIFKQFASGNLDPTLLPQKSYGCLPTQEEYIESINKILQNGFQDLPDTIKQHYSDDTGQVDYRRFYRDFKDIPEEKISSLFPQPSVVENPKNENEETNK